ncbi:MAG: leishmanolysin-related zinc metalloendopeptidase [Gemmatimonas sp.]
MLRTSSLVAMRRVGSGIALTVLLQACGGGDGPPVPTTFAPTGGSTLQFAGTAGTLAPTAPQVQILDAKGAGIKGLRVRWRVGANSGVVIIDSTVTDALGMALSGGWNLGTIAGTQTLTASADGLPAITFTAQVGPGPAASLIRLSPSTQDAAVNTNVAQPPSVRAEDVFGNVVPGVAVFFSVASGGGTIVGEQQTTNQSGIATAGAWRLGTGVGQQIARATSPTSTQAAFSATAIAGPPADIVKVAGDNQEAVPGFAVGISPGVRIVDAFSNPVGNVPVTFTPGPNSGTVLNGTVVSDPANGNAFVGSWTVGSGANPTLVATSSLLPGKSVTFNAVVVSSAFYIIVQYVGEQPSPAQQQAVARSAAKWRAAIVSTSGISRQIISAGGCGRSWMPAIDTVVTNLIIFANIGPIDGVGGTLGNANLCRLHPTGLAAVGTMLFDSADLTDLETVGLTDAVITHEMGHSLGIGTRWSASGFLTDAGGADPIFTGPSATAQFLLVGGATYTGRPVPVENTGGAGTRDSHWRETTFRNELMTGFVNLGINPLSRVSIGSLQDLGYTVTFTGADSYALPGSALQQRSPFTTVRTLGNDIAPIPADERAQHGLDRPVPPSSVRRP